MDYNPWLLNKGYIIFPFIMKQKGNFLYRKVAEQIIVVRKKKNISQEQLALLSDVDRTYMARIEEGKANPSLKVLHKLASTLRIPLKDLLMKV